MYARPSRPLPYPTTALVAGWVAPFPTPPNPTQPTQRVATAFAVEAGAAAQMLEEFLEGA